MQRADKPETPPSSPQIDVVIGVVQRDDGHVLVCQRKAEGHLGGYWEFPGGKREPGESLEQCLARELEEELAIRIRILFALDVIEHDYPAVRVRLHPYLCAHTDGVPQPIACQRTEWVAPPRLPDYRFPPANDALIAQLVRRLSDHPLRTT
jgi:mutator protein MutT